MQSEFHKIVIVGQGHVGLPVAMRAVERSTVPVLDTKNRLAGNDVEKL